MMTKQEAWEFAFGMVQVDAVTPSPEMLELAEKEIRGEMSADDMREYLHEKYAVK